LELDALAPRDDLRDVAAQAGRVVKTAAAFNRRSAFKLRRIGGILAA
jgi:hypothetical protein